MESSDFLEISQLNPQIYGSIFVGCTHLIWDLFQFLLSGCQYNGSTDCLLHNLWADVLGFVEGYLGLGSQTTLYTVTDSQMPSNKSYSV